MRQESLSNFVVDEVAVGDSTHWRSWADDEPNSSLPLEGAAPCSIELAVVLLSRDLTTKDLGALRLAGLCGVVLLREAK